VGDAIEEYSLHEMMNEEQQQDACGEGNGDGSKADVSDLEFDKPNGGECFVVEKTRAYCLVHYPHFGPPTFKGIVSTKQGLDYVQTELCEEYAPGEKEDPVDLKDEVLIPMIYKDYCKSNLAVFKYLEVCTDFSFSIRPHGDGYCCGKRTEPVPVTFTQYVRMPKSAVVVSTVVSAIHVYHTPDPSACFKQNWLGVE